MLATLAPTPALAGAWIAPKEGQEIWTSAAGQDESGALFSESALYLEAPTSERWAVVVAPWVEQGETVSLEGWRAEATFALKHALMRNRHGAMAVQAGAVWRSDPSFGCGEAGAEARWMGGLSFGRSGRGFVNVEAAARLEEGGCWGERFDLTAGFRTGENWLAMAQVFTDAPRDGRTVLLGQASLVRFRSEGRGIQVGLRMRLDGEALEPALVLGFWGRPGQ